MHASDMIRSMYYYLVAPNKIVRAQAQAFTYSSEERLDIGTIVAIEVGKSELVGIVLQSVVEPEFTVKPISRVIYTASLPLPLVQTGLWMSDYYNTHLATVWQTILPRGITKKRRSKAIPPREIITNRTKNVFTKDQQRALQTITDMTPGTALLHGITGAGKTLVYVEAARRALEENLSVIILVPEIALTSQLVNEFSQHFDNILLTHSRQTEAERHIIWQRALTSNEPYVVIGPRSALFIPVQQLGLIVIDECHEPSFKQEQSPRYSALRTASILAAQHEAKVILGSATPTISDHYLAQHSNRPIITMSQPARSNTVKPTVRLVDMTKRTDFTRHQFLSNTLLSSLEQTFATDPQHQALIFHNRRGTASTTLCQSCGWQAGCPRCFIPLTLHADRHQLTCHICGMSSRVPTDCPECHNADIIHKGIGTKRIETELARLFPNKKIARFDADTDDDDTVDKRYGELHDGSIDIIIGTQVIAKGLDLPHLRTVGVVQADAGLSLPDFGSPERTFQLLAQVIGRVGRSHHPTEVVVQSYQPNHPAIVDGLTQNYTDFYDRTIAQRRVTKFPPFTHLLKLICTYKTETTAIKNAKKLAAELRAHAPEHIQILGPTPAFYERVRDTYRWQIVVKSPHRTDLQNLLSLIPPTHWQFELDPTSLL